MDTLYALQANVNELFHFKKRFCARSGQSEPVFCLFYSLQGVGVGRSNTLSQFS
ncbi:hypothetical protein D3C78_661540 [compost metagenome]